MTTDPAMETAGTGGDRSPPAYLPEVGRETAAGEATADMLAAAWARELAHRSVAYDVTKRVFDLVFSSLMLIVLSPLMLAMAVLVKLTSRGPVLFKQARAGLGGKPFTMLKFRSMRRGAQEDREYFAHLNEQEGPVFKIADDPRLTLLGRFMRRTSIDELPQLLNVLAGRMSIVGPRPLWLPEALQAKGKAILRTYVKPGLTCLWQISGRSELSYERWVELDIYYIENRTLLLDALIIIKTIPAVLSGKGAY